MKKLTSLCKKTSTKIKGPGVLFFFFTILIGAIAVNSGNNLVYLTFSTIFSFLILSGLLSYFNLKGITVELRQPEISFAEKDTILSVKINNTSKMPKFLLVIKFWNLKETFFYVDSVSVKNATVRFEKRGLKRLRYITISSIFPFDFFERSQNIKINFEMIIAPPVKKILIENKARQKKENKTNFAYGEADFYSIRKYRDGEDSRKISWPISARTGKIMIIEKTKEKGKKLKLFLDNSLYSYPDPKAFESDISKIASVVYLCYKNRYKVSLISEKKFPFSKNLMHFKTIFEFLGTVKLEGNLPIKKPLDAVSGKDILYA